MISKFIKVSIGMAMVALLMGVSVQAADAWQLLGERTITSVDQGVSIENDYIGRVDKIKVSVENADLKINKLVLNYRMRQDDVFTDFEVLKAGGHITPIDVPGFRASVQSVTVEYEILGGKETALLKIWVLR